MPKCVKSETQIVINYKKIDKNSVLLYRVVMSYWAVLVLLNYFPFWGGAINTETSDFWQDFTILKIQELPDGLPRLLNLGEDTFSAWVMFSTEQHKHKKKGSRDLNLTRSISYPPEEAEKHQWDPEKIGAKLYISGKVDQLSRQTQGTGARPCSTSGIREILKCNFGSPTLMSISCTLW